VRQLNFKAINALGNWGAQYATAFGGEIVFFLSCVLLYL
jgi:hypothetical protein